MSWNHRVFRDSDGTLTVRETFYNEDGEVYGWTGPMEPAGFPEDPETGAPAGDREALFSLGWELGKFQAALCLPILDEEKTLEMIRAKAKKTKPKKEKLKKSAE